LKGEADEMNRIRTRKRMSLGFACCATFWAFVAGCSKAPEPQPENPPAAPASPEAIPNAPLNGTIGGEPFTLKDARYYVDQRPGYEKIDIKLSEVSAKMPCSELDSAKGKSLWLRRKGTDKLEPQTVNISLDKQGPWEAHYQIYRDGQWFGNGEANALFVIRDVRPDMKLEGELWSCFRDGTASCAKGRFSASYCRIRIDAPVRGTEAMERPPAGKLPPKSATKLRNGSGDATEQATTTAGAEAP
jgi:hypothetical protein